MKRVVASVLSAMLILGCVPVTAHAAEVQDEYICCDGPKEFYIHGHIAEAQPLTCYYYDSYFEGDSIEYNPSLATMSLCFQLSCNALEGDSNWTTDINDEYPQFKLARDLLIGDINDESDIGLGFTDFYVNEDWGTEPGRDTVGVVIARKLLPDGSNLIAVGIRGDHYASEWAGDFTIGKSGEHAGFSRAKDRALKALDDYFTKFPIDGELKLWVVGYSRAGVTANLTAAEIADGYEFKNVGKIAPENLFAYCFAVPYGTVEEDASAERYARIHNIVNYNDLVALVAPAVWGFTRFNAENDVFLPNLAEYGEEFYDMLSRALVFFNQLEGTDEFEYIIRETVSLFKITDINWCNILPDGNPVIESEECIITTRELLNNVMDILANDVFGDRETYYYQWEAGIRDILALILGGDFLGSFENPISPYEFISRFFSNFTIKDIWNISSPMVAQNSDGLLTRLHKVNENMNRFVRDLTSDSELWGTVTFSAGFADSMADMLYRLMESSFTDLFNGDATKISSVFSFIKGIIGGYIIQSHYAEVNLAWIMSMDENYMGLSSEITERGHRVFKTSSSANVEVLSSSGTVATVLDGQFVDGTVAVNDSLYGEVSFSLPIDVDYTVIIRPTYDETLYCSVYELSGGMSTVSRTVVFDEAEIKSGDTVTFSLPSSAKGVGTLGSDAEYTLRINGNTFENKQTLYGDNNCNVTLKRNLSYGIVSGSGTFSYGSLVQVSASPVNGSKFNGWYSGGRLISKESVYSFRITEDTTLTAKFTAPTLYPVVVSAGVGGSVKNKSYLSLAKGTRLKLSASCDEGYAFAGWKCVGGELEDAHSSETWVTVKKSAVIVRAVFKKLGDSKFYDVGKYDYYYRPAIWAVENGITNGTSETEFSPDDSCTRAQAVTFLWRMAGSPVPEITSSPFMDIDSDVYYYDAVLWAVENGITLGTSDTTFSPDDTVTRAQAMTFIHRYAGGKTVKAFIPFVDVKQSEYCYEAVKWAYKGGIASGTSIASFSPDMPCTRAQLVTFLYRFSD